MRTATNGQGVFGPFLHTETVRRRKIPQFKGNCHFLCLSVIILDDCENSFRSGVSTIHVSGMPASVNIPTTALPRFSLEVRTHVPFTLSRFFLNLSYNSSVILVIVTPLSDEFIASFYLLSILKKTRLVNVMPCILFVFLINLTIFSSNLVNFLSIFGIIFKKPYFCIDSAKPICYD